MPIVVGNVLKLTDCQTLFGQSLCNVFYYLVSVWTGNADIDDVLTDWIAGVLPTIIPIQHGDLTHIEVAAENVSTGLEFGSQAIAVSGGIVAAPSLPSYVAASFRLERTTRLTRPGFKRLGGVPENLVDDNDYDVGLAAVIAAANVMGAVVNMTTPAPGDGQLTPVIVGRNTDGSLDLTRVAPVTSVSPILNISTQVSRKPGR